MGQRVEAGVFTWGSIPVGVGVVTRRGDKRLIKEGFLEEGVIDQHRGSDRPIVLQNSHGDGKKAKAPLLSPRELSCAAGSLE